MNDALTKLKIAEGFLRDARAEIERLTEENLELKKAKSEPQRHRHTEKCPYCGKELSLLDVQYMMFGPSEGEE